MNSLLRTRALLAPSRHAFASTSSFHTTTATLAPPPKAKAADAMVGLLDSVMNSEDYEMGGLPEDQGASFKNLPVKSVISPQQLSPRHLLIPYLPKPDFSLAYPLGPPVTAARTHDPFVRFDISPLDSPMNPWLRTEFCTSMGKIKTRGKTGLQRGSQRKMGKAVRRARSMGVVATFGTSVPSEK